MREISAPSQVTMIGINNSIEKFKQNFQNWKFKFIAFQNLNSIFKFNKKIQNLKSSKFYKNLNLNLL